MTDQFDTDIAAAAAEIAPKPQRSPVTEGLSKPYGNVTAEGYEPLAVVLNKAFEQSAYGKGRQRHANGATSSKNKPFDRQPIMEIGRMVGLGYPAGQVQKKIQEAIGMVGRGQHDAAQAEVLGAIVYAAALWQLIEESK